MSGIAKVVPKFAITNQPNMLRIRARVKQFFATKEKKGKAKAISSLPAVSLGSKKGSTCSQKSTKEKYKNAIIFKKILDFFRDYPLSIRYSILYAKTVEQQIEAINQLLTEDAFPPFFLNKFFAIFTREERLKIIKLLHTENDKKIVD